MDPVDEALTILSKDFRIDCPTGFQDRVDAYGQLLTTWNPYAGLISQRDLLHRFHHHIADALTLAPYIKAATDTGLTYIDVGSGGGLPAIPILLALGPIPAYLVDRQERKAAFLTKAVAALQLTRACATHGAFPADVPDVQPVVLTARAIEKPNVFLVALADYLGQESIFLCQPGATAPQLPARLQADRIQDRFDEAGIRRGILLRVRSAQP